MTSPNAPVPANEAVFTSFTFGVDISGTTVGSFVGSVSGSSFVSTSSSPLSETSLTVGPLGGVPVTVAEFFTSPESRSAWAMLYVAVAVPTPLGARIAGLTARFVRFNFASAIVKALKVTLPVLVTVKVYVITSPKAPVPAIEAVFTSFTFGVDVSGTTVGSFVGSVSGSSFVSTSSSPLSDTSLTVGPLGGVPVTVAEFFTSPESRSAWAIVYVAVAVPTPLGARIAGLTARFVRFNLASAIDKALKVTLPVLVTVNVYVITSPTAPAPANDAVFTSCTFGAGINGTTVGSLLWSVSGSSSVSTSSSPLSETSLTVGPLGGVPVTIAEFFTSPESRSV